MSAGDSDLWEQSARWWQATFTGGVDAEYVEQIFPLVSQHLPRSGRVLDVGTGEGQIARLAAGPRAAVGLDPTWSQLAEARRRGGGPDYARGTAANLPFASLSFDAVIACHVLEHLPELEEAVAPACDRSVADRDVRGRPQRAQLVSTDVPLVRVGRREKEMLG